MIWDPGPHWRKKSEGQMSEADWKSETSGRSKVRSRCLTRRNQLKQSESMKAESAPGSHPELSKGSEDRCGPGRGKRKPQDCCCPWDKGLLLSALGVSSSFNVGRQECAIWGEWARVCIGSTGRGARTQKGEKCVQPVLQLCTIQYPDTSFLCDVFNRGSAVWEK